MDHTTIADCYRNHTVDYFHRMGGAARYAGYEDWHPAVLTLGCAYQALQVRTFSELKPFWSRLPLPIMSGCDDLRHKTLKLITANIDDTVVAVPFLKWVEVEICESVKRSYGHEAAAVFTKKMAEIKNDLGLPVETKTVQPLLVPSSVKIDVLRPDVSDIVTQDFVEHCCELYKLDHFGNHGYAHWMRVLYNGRTLAAETGANVRIVELFALLHDTHRENEFEDPEHGPRAAAYAQRLLDGEISEFQFDFTADEKKQLLIAIHDHSKPMNPRKIRQLNIGVCWDADRLDLQRVGIRPQPHGLYTRYACESDVIRSASFRAQQIRL